MQTERKGEKNNNIQFPSLIFSPTLFPEAFCGKIELFWLVQLNLKPFTSFLVSQREQCEKLKGKISHGTRRKESVDNDKRLNNQQAFIESQNTKCSISI